MPEPGTMAVFAVVTFVIGQVQWFSSLVGDTSATDHAKLIAKLNEIKDITMNTDNGVKELLNAVDYLDEQLSLEKAKRTITSHFNRMGELKRHNAHENEWNSWAEDVLDDNTGTSHALNEINFQITDNNVIDKFKNKMELAARAKDKRVSRTITGGVTDFFKFQIFYEMLGFSMMQEANKHRKDWPKLNYEYKVMIARFNKQIQKFKTVAASMPATSYLRNERWENKEYFNMEKYEYAHLWPVEADVGKVVTGVQLYKYGGNRFAIKIKQGKLRECGIIESETWKGASGWGEKVNYHYTKVHNGYDGGAPYFNTNKVKAPRGKAIVGFQFWKNGSLLKLAVKVASVDFLSGNISDDADWIMNPIYEESNKNVNSGRTPYVDTWKVETKPPSMLTAAALYQKHNRMAIEVSDIFTPFIQGVSCPKYSNVKMTGNFRCCDDYLFNQASQTCPRDGKGPKYVTPVTPVTTVTTVTPVTPVTPNDKCIDNAKVAVWCPYLKKSCKTRRQDKVAYFTWWSLYVRRMCPKTCKLC